MKYMMTISMSVALVLWSIIMFNHMYRGLNWMPLFLIWIFMIICVCVTYRTDNSKW